MDEDCAMTLEKMRDLLNAEFGPLSVSLATICRAIDHFDYSFKRILNFAAAGVSPEADQRRVQYSQQYMGQLALNKEFIFIDEVGFKASQRISQGYAKKGVRSRCVIPRIQTRNITIMAPMTRHA